MLALLLLWLLAIDGGSGGCRIRQRVAHQRENIYRQREDYGGVFFDADFGEGLQVAELHGERFGGQEVGGFYQLLGGVEFTLGVDDLGTGLAGGFGLLGHGAEHLFGQVDLFDFDGLDFDAEGLGALIDDGLDAQVELVAMAEEFVEFDFT